MIAHEFVALQRGGNLVSGERLIPAGVHPAGAHDLSHATQIDHLRLVASQRDHVLDGTAEIGFPFHGKKHPARADILGATSQFDTCRAGTCD